MWCYQKITLPISIVCPSTMTKEVVCPGLRGKLLWIPQKVYCRFNHAHKFGWPRLGLKCLLPCLFSGGHISINTWHFESHTSSIIVLSRTLSIIYSWFNMGKCLHTCMHFQIWPQIENSKYLQTHNQAPVQTMHLRWFITTPLPLFFPLIRYVKQQHLVDVTEIYNQLRWEKRLRFLKLAYLLFLFFVSLFWYSDNRHSYTLDKLLFTLLEQLWWNDVFPFMYNLF